MKIANKILILNFISITNIFGMQPPAKKQKVLSPSYVITRQQQKTFDINQLGLTGLSKFDQFAKLSNKIQADDFTYIKTWLSTEPDINITNRDGKTLLHIATENKTFDILKLLLEKGTNPNIVDSYENAPIDLILSEIVEEGPGNRREEILDLLIKHGANINNKDSDGNTALHSSAAHEGSQPHFIDFLTRKGANPFLKNLDGQMPIDLATDSENRLALKAAMQRR